MDMCHGPLPWQIFRFSIPILLAGFLSLSFSMADSIVIGRYGSAQSLGAVGVTSPIVGFLLTVFSGLAVGASVIIAQHFGAGDKVQVRRSVHTAVSIAIIGGLTIMAIAQIAMWPLLKLMRIPADIIHKTCTYMRIYCCGIPLTVLYSFCYGVLRAVGDTRNATLYLVASGSLNVALNLLFVIVFHLDVKGVAFATIASQSLSTFLIVRNLHHAHDACRLSGRLLFRINRPIALRMLRIGLPAGFQTAFYSFANLVLVATVGTLPNGALALAGYAAAINMENLLWRVAYAFHQTAMSFVGQNYGGQEYGRAKRSVLLCLAIQSPFVALLGWGFYLGAETIVSFYTTDQSAVGDVVMYARQHMKYCFTLYVLCGVGEVLAGALRGLGVSLLPAVFSFLGIFVFRMIWVAFVFPIPRFHTMAGLYMCYPFSWIIALVPNAFLLVWHMRRMADPDYRLGQIKRERKS